jgi:NAD-dependent deacetylase
VEALVEDAVRFERADGFGVDPAKTPVSGSSPAVFRRVVLRASLALFGGGVSAVSAAEGTADGARLRPPAPPPRLIPTETETLSDTETLLDAETLVSAEWWPFWSGARAAAAAAVERAARLLARPSVSRVVFFTGAGASAESGMPAFRETVPGAADVDADGVRVGPATPLDALLPIWKTHDPEKYSTLSAFREDPGACWFLHRRMFDQMRGLRPNDAHVAIETLAGAGVPNTRTETSANENASSLKETGFEVTVVTQNIDGLHQTAAAASRTSTRTIELHGSTRRVACLERCGWSEDAETFLRLWDPPATRVTVREKARTGAEEEEEGERHTDGKRKRRSEEVCFESSDGNGVVGSSRSNKKKRTTTRVPGAFPTCGGCGVAPAKPACVFFGEALPDAAVKAARAACARAHAVVIVGTSLSVFSGGGPAPAGARAHAQGASIARVDARASATSAVGPDDAVIAGGAAARAVPALARRVPELRDGSRGYVAEDAEGARRAVSVDRGRARPRGRFRDETLLQM